MVNLSLCEKCPYSRLLWSVFSRIRAEYGPEEYQIRTLFTQRMWFTYGDFTSCFLFTYSKDAHMVNPSRREKERKLIQIFIFALVFCASNYSMKAIMQLFGTHEAGRVKWRLFNSFMTEVPIMYKSPYWQW